MTPAKVAKQHGLKNLKQASDMLGTKSTGHPVVSPQCLDNWFHDKPLLFDAVILGLAAKLNNED